MIEVKVRPQGQKDAPWFTWLAHGSHEPSADPKPEVGQRYASIIRSRFAEWDVSVWQDGKMVYDEKDKSVG